MSTRTDWPEYAAAQGTHEAVLGLVDSLVQGRSGLTACDVPCGAGIFSKRVSELGVNVTAVDIAPVDAFVFDQKKRILHDCNLGLPFADNSLDLVISIEGIEHLENPTRFLRECQRVAKPGGTIIVTTPNVDSFRSRRYVFLKGYHKFFGPGEVGEKDSGHMLPIDAMFVVNAARKIGINLQRICTNSQTGKSWFKEIFRKRLQSTLPDYLRNETLYYGEVAIYVFCKPV